MGALTPIFTDSPGDKATVALPQKCNSWNPLYRNKREKMYKSTCIIRLTNSTEMHDGRLQCWSLTHTYRQRDRPNCEAAFSLFTRHVCTYNVQQSALSSTWHFLLVFVRPSLSLFSLWVYFTNCRHKLLTVVYRLHTTHWLGADLITHHAALTPHRWLHAVTDTDV